MYNEPNFTPAFPTGDNPDSKLYADPGMSLRDYFAAKAMAAMIGNDWPMHSEESTQHLTDSAYRMADAMLEARAK